MRWLRRVFAIVALAPVCFAQKITPPADAAAQVQKIFASFDHTDTPGCAVGVSLDDAIVLSRAYGMADLEHNVVLTPESVFEPGSITKQFTAAAVLLLAQDGKLSLDDPVRKYIPELPDYGTPITIRHLLNHTSGLRDWGVVAAIEGWPRGTRASSNLDVLEIVSRQKALNYTPGAAYSYTNSGYNLLAILVGRVAGKPLPEFTRERIFLPLEMHSTQWRDDFQRIVPNRAMAYQQEPTGIRQSMPFENAHGNGGLLTTVGDLLRWDNNFTEMKVGGAALIDEELKQGRLNDGRIIAYAAGLEVLKYKGVREVSHSGATAGYSAWLGRYPDQGMSVAVLCNTTAANAYRMGHEVAEVYLGNLLANDEVRPAVGVDPAVLQDEAGVYRSDRDHTAFRLVVKDGHLETADGAKLRSVSARSFTFGNGGIPEQFKTDSAGKVIGLHFANDVDGGHDSEKVPAANPSHADLESLVGEYASDEARVTLSVALDATGLAIHRRPDTVYKLEPTYKDGFSSSLGSVRFIRDSAGHVVEMSIGSDRMWDLRLRRLADAGQSAKNRW